MLKKLLKYDFKATNKYAIPFSIFILLYALITTPFFSFVNLTESGLGGKVAIVLITVFFCIFLVLYVASISFIQVIHFYQNMVTDQGYLTHTLPVKKSKIITSKLICAVFNMLVACIIACLAAFIFFDVPSFISLYKGTVDDIWNTFYPQINALDVILVIAYGLIATCQGITMIYVSIALGQLINRHKVLGSIIFYFAITMAYQIIGSIIGIATTAVTISGHTDIATGEVVFDLPHNSLGIIAISCLVCIIITAVQLFVTNYIFTKKLNLE